MPRTKLGDSVAARRQRSTPELRVGALIFGTAAMRDVSQRQLAEMIGVSPATLCVRKKDMGQLTLSEMFSLCEALNISERSLRDALFQLEEVTRNETK